MSTFWLIAGLIIIVLLVIGNIIVRKYKNDDYLKGYTLFNKGLYSSALDCFDAALQKKPDHVFSLVSGSACCLALREWQKGMDFADRAISLSPKNALAYANRSGLALGMQQCQKAIDDATIAIELDPKMFLAHYNRALAYVALHRYEDCLAEAPLLAKYNLFIARLISLVSLLGLNKIEAAATLYDQISANSYPPEERGRLVHLCALLNRATGDFDKTIELCTAIDSDESVMTEALALRAYAYCMTGRVELAAPDLDALERLPLPDGSKAEMLATRAFMLSLKGDKSCSEVADSALLLSAQIPEVLCRTARAYMFVDDAQKAKKVLDSAIAIDSYCAEAYWLRHELAQKSGDADGAQNDLALARQNNYYLAL